LRTPSASRIGLFAEAILDRGHIGIAARQCPKSMEMVRQNADGVPCEWPARPDRTINLPQAFDLLRRIMA
jgi:hypothetical protein